MACHYPDLGSASDWLTQTSHALWPFRNTTQIWVVTLHQYGISALVFQTSFRGETVGGVAKCRLFSQAINVLVLLCLVSSHLSWSSSPLSPELSKNVFPVKLLTLSYQFWPERFPYRIFTKCTGFEICKKSQNQNFFWTFSQTEMTHFPTLSYTSISKREFLPFHLPKAEIDSPFRVKPFRIGHFWGYPLGMCSGVKDSQWWKTTACQLLSSHKVKTNGKIIWKQDFLISSNVRTRMLFTQLFVQSLCYFTVWRISWSMEVYCVLFSGRRLRQRWF